MWQSETGGRGHRHWDRQGVERWYRTWQRQQRRTFGEQALGPQPRMESMQHRSAGGGGRGKACMHTGATRLPYTLRA